MAADAAALAATYAPELELIGSLTWNDEVVVVLRKQAPDLSPGQPVAPPPRSFGSGT